MAKQGPGGPDKGNEAKSDKTSEKKHTDKPTGQSETEKKEKKVKTSASDAKPAKKDVKAGSPKKPSNQGGGHRHPLAPKTFYPKQGDLSEWKLIDAKGIALGRLSSQVAHLLMGKSKAAYTRFVDTGDFVVVVNAKEVVLTGNKWEDKKYHYHTNYPGGIKTITAKELLKTHPERLVEWAVYGMLPKGHMGRRWHKKLRVFAGPDHDHQAQKPQPYKLASQPTRE